MSCTIIIFHFESLAYLRACIRQIRKYKRDDIPYKIIIADQSINTAIISTLYSEFLHQSDIEIVHMSQYGSGYSVDYIIRQCNITDEFICTIDVDTIPIHKNWLYVPIKLIQDAGFHQVGVHAQIECAYANMGDFFCMCQHYRIARNETYRALSLSAGFTKNDHRKKLLFTNNEWKGWSDDAIIAHWWEDKYLNHNKFTFAVTNYLGVAPTEGRYGRYTDDLVFHIGFSYNWKMVRDAKVSMGSEFLWWMAKMENGGLTDELLQEMLDSLIPLESPIIRIAWDGINKSIYTPNDELNMLVNKLKSE